MFKSSKVLSTCSNCAGIMLWDVMGHVYSNVSILVVISVLLCHAVPWDCLMPGWQMTSWGTPTVHLISVLMNQIWVTPVNVCNSSHQRSAGADDTRRWTEKSLRLFQQPTDNWQKSLVCIHCHEAQPRLKKMDVIQRKIFVWCWLVFIYCKAY